MNNRGVIPWWAAAYVRSAQTAGLAPDSLSRLSQLAKTMQTNRFSCGISVDRMNYAVHAVHIGGTNVAVR